MGLRSFFQRLFGHVEPDAVLDAAITADGFRFTIARDDGWPEPHVRLVRWDDVQRIELHQVQGGGHGDRIHYLFHTPDMKVRVARTAPGFRTIEDRLPRLPGFDAWTYAWAQRQQHDMPVPIWERGKVPETASRRDLFIHVFGDIALGA